MQLDSYQDIDEELIDKPIPIVYGRWDYEHGSETHYGNRSFVPMYLIENNIDLSTPQLKFEIADHAIDRIGHDSQTRIFIFDDDINTVGQILDDTTESLANGQVTLDLNTSSELDLMQAEFFIYPNKVEIEATDITDLNNSIDHDYDTIMVFEGSAVKTPKVNFFFPAGQISKEDLFPILADSSGESTIGVISFEVEMSGYGSGTWAGDDRFAIAFENPAEV